MHTLLLVACLPLLLTSSTSSTATRAELTGTNGTIKGSYLTSAWYTAWHHKYITWDINWDLYSSVSYAFAVTDNEEMVGLTSDDPEGVILRELVKEAHGNDTKVMLTIGGWTGSMYFSNILAKPDKRKSFTEKATQMAHDYGVDGLEFDWEFPNKAGLGCNAVDKDDSANYLVFLQELRQHLEDQKWSYIISAAVSDKPFLDPSGKPMTNVSAFAEVLDYITIMNYDVWTVSDGILGPNAPLNDTCAEPTHQHGSAVSAVDAWTAAGFPTSKLVLGVPAYGRSAFVHPNSAYNGGDLNVFPPLDAHATVAGDWWDSNVGTDPCGDAYDWSGLWTWTNLLPNFTNPDTPLQLNGSANTTTMDYFWDDCSKTPRLYDRARQVMISYDDLNSVKAKADFITGKGLHGSALWEIAGDGSNALLSAMLAYSLNATGP